MPLCLFRLGHLLSAAESERSIRAPITFAFCTAAEKNAESSVSAKTLLPCYGTNSGLRKDHRRKFAGKRKHAAKAMQHVFRFNRLPITPGAGAAMMPWAAHPMTVMPIAPMPIPAALPMMMAWSDLDHDRGCRRR